MLVVAEALKQMLVVAEILNSLWQKPKKKGKGDSPTPSSRSTLRGSDSTLRSDLSGGRKVVSLNKWGLLASSLWYIYLQAYCVSSIVSLFISFPRDAIMNKRVLVPKLRAYSLAEEIDFK